MLDIPNKKINYSPNFRNLVPGENVEFEPKDHRVTEVSSQGGGSDVPIVATPVVTVEDSYVSATCNTEGATILYVDLYTGKTKLYTEPFKCTKERSFIFFATKGGMLQSSYSPIDVKYNGYLTFTAVKDATIRASVRFSNELYKTPYYIEYSLDDGETWNEWEQTEKNLYISFSNLSLSKGDSVLMRGVNKFLSKTSGSTNVATFRFLTPSGAVNASGKIDSLLNYKDTVPLAEGCYSQIFYDCDSLLTAPDLPDTALSNHCYDSMFYGCNSLVNAPELPATTLADSCYKSMFYGCTALVNAPELPATTLASNCYQEMFSSCVSLVNAPELPATTLASNCYDGMFMGCSALVNAPELPATTLADSCYNQMFRNCSALVNAPELPATTLANGCYSYMFFNCDGLLESPELPATTLAINCYTSMFSSCESLMKAPDLPNATMVSNCYERMFSGCSALSSITVHNTKWNSNYCSQWVAGVSANGTFTKPSGTNIIQGYTNGIPSGWTVVNI